MIQTPESSLSGVFSLGTSPHAFQTAARAPGSIRTRRQGGPHTSWSPVRSGASHRFGHITGNGIPDTPHSGSALSLIRPQIHRTRQHKALKQSGGKAPEAGARGGGRTHNLRLRRPTLYPIELPVQNREGENVVRAGHRSNPIVPGALAVSVRPKDQRRPAAELVGRGSVAGAGRIAGRNPDPNAGAFFAVAAFFCHARYP